MSTIITGSGHDLSPARWQAIIWNKKTFLIGTKSIAGRGVGHTWLNRTILIRNEITRTLVFSFVKINLDMVCLFIPLWHCFCGIIRTSCYFENCLEVRDMILVRCQWSPANNNNITFSGWTRSSLVQAVTCRLLGAKPSSEAKHLSS